MLSTVELSDIERNGSKLMKNVDRVLNVITALAVAIIVFANFFPVIRADSTDVWTQINNAVENMRPSVTVASSTPWSWTEMLSLEYGGANLASYSYSTNYNGTITYYFTYSVRSQSEYAAMKAEIDSVAAQIIAGIPSCTTGVEKARMIHDWLITNTVYDYGIRNPRSFNIYGVFHDHMGRCCGFAAAFKFLMNRIGEECSIVSSGTHSWNQVSSNPNIYIDCTWDNMDYTSDNGVEFIEYECFGMTDEDLLGLDSHVITDRSQIMLGSHPEYLNGDCVATVSFDDFNMENITYYCNQMNELGFTCYTLDFNNSDAYQRALNELPYYMYNLSCALNMPGNLRRSHNDGLQVITIYVGDRHDMVSSRG